MTSNAVVANNELVANNEVANEMANNEVANEMANEMVNDTLAVTHYLRTNNLTKPHAALLKLSNHGITVVYDKTRTVLSVNKKYKYKINNILMQECNGLILDNETWDPLMVPTRTLRRNIDTNTSDKFLHQGLYRIHYVEDGTTFNMYYYNSRWIISTSNSYEMNHVIWNDLTYENIITECLKTYDLTWEQFTSELNKKHCYSFGFKHPDFHNFHYDFEQSGSKETNIIKLWFIQSVNLDKTSKEYLWAVENNPISVLPTQKPFTLQINNLKELYKIASYAYKNFVTNGTINYGFILRSVNTELTELHSDLLIESSLMKKIKNYFYHENITTLCKMYIDPKESKVHELYKQKKDKLITFITFLKQEDKEFITLFPQFTEHMNCHNKFIDKLVNEIIENYNNTDLNKTNPNLNAIINRIKQLKYKFDFTDIYTNEVLKQFLININNLDLLTQRAPLGFTL